MHAQCCDDVINAVTEFIPARPDAAPESTNNSTKNTIHHLLKSLKTVLSGASPMTLRMRLRCDIVRVGASHPDNSDSSSSSSGNGGGSEADSSAAATFCGGSFRGGSFRGRKTTRTGSGGSGVGVGVGVGGGVGSGGGDVGNVLEDKRSPSPSRAVPADGNCHPTTATNQEKESAGVRQADPSSSKGPRTTFAVLNELVVDRGHGLLSPLLSSFFHHPSNQRMCATIKHLVVGNMRQTTECKVRLKATPP
jgi:hypothetical protein